MGNDKKMQSQSQYFCCSCGKFFDSPTEFNSSRSEFYSGIGRLPICRECLVSKFNDYSERYGNKKTALKRLCMAFDLYYSESLYNSCKNDTDAFMGNYIKRLNMYQFSKYTFETSLQEGFYFDDSIYTVSTKKKRGRPKRASLSAADSKDSVTEEEEEKKISAVDESKWGSGFDFDDYKILNEHYKYIKDANPQCDSNQEIFINDLCYTKMQQLKAAREGRVEDYKKMTESYIKTFEKAGLKTIQDQGSKEEVLLGVTGEIIERYTPAEYYKKKDLYKDHDGLGDYIERFFTRPFRNLMFGTKDRDKEYYVHEEEEVGFDNDE